MVRSQIPIMFDRPCYLLLMMDWIHLYLDVDEYSGVDLFLDIVASTFCLRLGLRVFLIADPAGDCRINCCI